MSHARKPRMGHVLNVAPVVLTGGSVKAERLPYEGDEQYKALRTSIGTTHVVRREGGSVLCVPIDADSASVGGEPLVVRLDEDLHLAAYLVRHALVAYLNNLDRTVLRLRPITLLADGKGDDYLANAIPEGVPNPGYLRVSPVFELDVRVVSPEDQNSYVALTLGGRVSRRILASCSRLMDFGVDVHGVYVKRISKMGDTRLAPKFETVGRVESVEGHTLHLTDHQEDVPAILASDAFPESRVEFFDRCVQSVFPDHAERIRTCVEEAMARFRHGSRLLGRLNDVRSHLATNALPLPQGAGCEIYPFLATKASSTAFAFPKLRRAESPVYTFDPASGTKRCEWPPDSGLSRYGPYSSRTFTPNRPRVCVICQRAKQGQVEQFLVKFREGLTHDRDGFQPFEKGFVDKYCLSGFEYELFLTEDSSAEAYRRAASSALSSGGPEGPKWDLVFVQIESRFRQLPVADNPYMVCKAAFLTHQLPVQAFRIETAELSAYNLCYALNNMGLATYAKMNGTPWLLRSDQPLLQELVIGLGSARIGDSRLGPGQRVVGITTVFSGDGNYCLANLSRASPFESYQDELLDTLRLAISQVRGDLGWRTEKPLRLVFHVGFKQFCDDEIAAVKQVMEELKEFDAAYAFVQIVDDHPFRLFDLAQKGKFDYRTKGKKGVLAPNRGDYLLLSEREVLIKLTGFREVKRPEDGVPRPILLKVHRDSTFNDPVYLARQVYAFAGHSWQGFFPCASPVTVEYSSMIARLLGQLATLPGWDSSALVGRIGWRRWFL